MQIVTPLPQALPVAALISQIMNIIETGVVPSRDELLSLLTPFAEQAYFSSIRPDDGLAAQCGLTEEEAQEALLRLAEHYDPEAPLSSQYLSAIAHVWSCRVPSGFATVCTLYFVTLDGEIGLPARLDLGTGEVQVDQADTALEEASVAYATVGDASSYVGWFVAEGKARFVLQDFDLILKLRESRESFEGDAFRISFKAEDRNGYITLLKTMLTGFSGSPIEKIHSAFETVTGLNPSFIEKIEPIHNL